jgi:hypothetical protein
MTQRMKSDLETATHGVAADGTEFPWNTEDIGEFAPIDALDQSMLDEAEAHELMDEINRDV